MTTPPKSTWSSIEGTDSNPICLHFGPGRLGLGLVVEQLLQARFDVCLIGSSRGEPERARFGLAVGDPDVGLRYSAVRWATNPETVGDLPAQIQYWLTGRAPILITAALGPHISDAAALLSELIDMRPAGAETILVSCENDPAPSYDQLARHHAQKLDYRASLVDRICTWPSTGPRDRHRRRVVVQQPTGEWLIPGVVQGSVLLSRLATAPLVRVTDATSIAGLRARKRWLENGLHMVYALMAWAEGIEQLPLKTEAEQRFVRTARPLASQIIAGIKQRHPDVQFLAGEGERLLRAFCETNDTTTRVVGKHLVRNDLRPFMERLDLRIGDAARAAHEAGQDCRPFADVMRIVVSALAARYVHQKSSGSSSALIDAEVVERFSAVLSGWLDRKHTWALTSTLDCILRGIHPPQFTRAQSGAGLNPNDRKPTPTRGITSELRTRASA